MSQKQREAALVKFMDAEVVVLSPIDDNSAGTDNSISYPELLDLLNIPSSVKQDICHKADAFEAGDIAKAPGSESYWVVKSTCGKPYLVEKAMCNKYSCEDRCTTYKSCKICAHTFAVAKLNNNLDGFVDWYKRNKQSINFSALAQAGIPIGGKKTTKAQRCH